MMKARRLAGSALLVLAGCTSEGEKITGFKLGSPKYEVLEKAAARRLQLDCDTMLLGESCYAEGPLEYFALIFRDNRLFAIAYEAPDSGMIIDSLSR